jgi:hypothetical protein
MVDVSEMYGLCLLSVVGYVIGSFLLGPQEDGIVYCSVVNVLFMEHAIKNHVLHLTPATALVCKATSGFALVLTRIMRLVLAFCSRRSKVFSQFSGGLGPSESML